MSNEKTRKAEVEIGQLMSILTDPYIAAIEAVRADHCGRDIAISAAVQFVERLAWQKHCSGGRMIFIGNGGSAAIASHMAEDWMKTAEIAALCFNDGAALTCYANDLGFDQVFAFPMRRHCGKHDLLFAISSSGESADILRACDVATEYNMDMITFSGKQPTNSLRKHGVINFYVPCEAYGPIEAAHLVLNHAILDYLCRE